MDVVSQVTFPEGYLHGYSEVNEQFLENFLETDGS